MIFAFLFLSSTSSDAATLGLAWDPPTDGVTAGYIVRYGTAPGSYTESIDVGLVNAYTIQSLADGARYYVAVQAYNSGRQLGPLSNEVSGVTAGAVGPAAPSSLSASVAGSQVNLSWQAPGGTVSGYRVEVGTGSGLTNVTVVDTGATTTYSVSGLIDGRYYIRVRTIASGVVSPPSNEVSVAVSNGSSGGGGTSNVPSNLVARVQPNWWVDLAWQAPGATVTGYRLEVGRGPGQTNVWMADTTATTATLTGLTEGVYYMRVRSSTSGDLSAPSNEVIVTVGSSSGGDTTTGPPANLVASVRDNQWVDLAWQAPSGSVSGYRIEVGTGSGQTNVFVTDAGTATAYSMSGLIAGTYYIRVRSITSSGVSAPSNEVTATIASSGGGGGTGGAPSNLVARVLENQWVDLAWQAPGSAVTGYRVEVGRGPDQTNVLVADLGTATTLTLTGLTDGTYWMRVRSYTSAGLSAPSNEVIVNIGTSSGGGTGGTSGSPTSVVATVRPNQWVDITWQAPGGTVTGYRVEVGRGPDQTNVLVADTGTATAYTLTGLTEGTYWLRVRSFSSAGLSAPSNEVVFTVGSASGGGGTSGAPSNLVASVGANQWVDLAWQAPGGTVTGYRVEVGRGPDQTNVLVADLGTATTFTLTGLTDGTYWMRVRSLSSGGVSAPSNEVVVTIGATALASADGVKGTDRRETLTDVVAEPDVVVAKSEAAEDRRVAFSFTPRRRWAFRS